MIKTIQKIGQKLRLSRFFERSGFAQIPLMIGLLIMAVAIPVASQLAQKNQDTRNLARECECVTNADCGSGWRCTSSCGTCVRNGGPAPTAKPPTSPPNPTNPPSCTNNCSDKANHCPGTTWTGNCGTTCSNGTKNCTVPPTAVLTAVPTSAPNCAGNGQFMGYGKPCCASAPNMSECTGSGVYATCKCTSAIPNTPTPSCVNGAKQCSTDGGTLRTCVSGGWTGVACQYGCANNACKSAPTAVPTSVGSCNNVGGLCDGGQGICRKGVGLWSPNYCDHTAMSPTPTPTINPASCRSCNYGNGLERCGLCPGGQSWGDLFSGYHCGTEAQCKPIVSPVPTPLSGQCSGSAYQCKNGVSSHCSFESGIRQWIPADQEVCKYGCDDTTGFCSDGTPTASPLKQCPGGGINDCMYRSPSLNYGCPGGRPYQYGSCQYRALGGAIINGICCSEVPRSTPTPVRYYKCNTTYGGCDPSTSVTQYTNVGSCTEACPVKPMATPMGTKPCGNSTNGTYRCDGSSAIERCTNGVWVRTLCATGYTCTGSGTCVRPIATPTAVGGTYYRCNSTYGNCDPVRYSTQYTTARACEDACKVPSPTATPTRGVMNCAGGVAWSYKCVGTTGIQRCDGNTGNWGNWIACAPGTRCEGAGTCTGARTSGTPYPSPRPTSNLPMPTPTTGGGTGCNTNYVSRLHLTDQDPWETNLTMTTAQKVNIGCIANGANLASNAKIIVKNGLGAVVYEVVTSAVVYQWAAPSSGTYKVTCVKQGGNCDGRSSDTATLTVTASTGGSCANECPSTFGCYQNGSSYKWFSEGYQMTGYSKVADSSCGAVTKPTFKGKSKGDANCDGAVNGTDYSIWRKEYQDGVRTGGKWLADFTGPNSTCDGKVDGTDYSLWRRTYIDFNGGNN